MYTTLFFPMITISFTSNALDLFLYSSWDLFRLFKMSWNRLDWDSMCIVLCHDSVRLTFSYSWFRMILIFLEIFFVAAASEKIEYQVIKLWEPIRIQKNNFVKTDKYSGDWVDAHISTAPSHLWSPYGSRFWI